MKQKNGIRGIVILAGMLSILSGSSIFAQKKNEPSEPILRLPRHGDPIDLNRGGALEQFGRIVLLQNTFGTPPHATPWRMYGAYAVTIQYGHRYLSTDIQYRDCNAQKQYLSVREPITHLRAVEHNWPSDETDEHIEESHPSYAQDPDGYRAGIGGIDSVRLESRAQVVWSKVKCADSDRYLEVMTPTISHYDYYLNGGRLDVEATEAFLEFYIFLLNFRMENAGNTFCQDGIDASAYDRTCRQFTTYNRFLEEKIKLLQKPREGKIVGVPVRVR